MREMKGVPLEERMQLLENDALATVACTMQTKDRKALPFLGHHLKAAQIVLDRRIAPIVRQEVTQEVKMTIQLIKRKYPTTKPGTTRKVTPKKKPARKKVGRKR